MNSNISPRFLLGAALFAITNRIDCRYLFPIRRLAEPIELLRTTALRLMGAKIAKSAVVRAGCLITNPRLLTIGPNSKIGPRSQLYLYETLTIGANVEIGSDLIVHTAEHRFDDPSTPLAKQGSIYSPVVIKDDVYFGSRVTILSGTTVAHRVVVAAGAVITKHCDANLLYGGIPAKPIRQLSEQ